MLKINGNCNGFNWVYKIGFFIILALPVLVIPPWIFPPDFGKTVIFRSVLAILLFLFLVQILLGKNKFSLPPNFKNNKIVWSLAALFVIFLLASIFSADPLFSFWSSPYRGGGFISFAFYIIFAVSAFILFKKEDWKMAWILSIIIGILVSLIAIFQYYGLFNKIFLSNLGGRPSSTMGNPDLLATYILLLFFIALCYAIKEKVLKTKIFYIFSLLLFLYTIIITGSRAAYLGIAIGAAYFFLFYPKKMKVLKTTFIGMLVVLAGFIFYINAAGQYPKFLEKNSIFNSVAQRVSAHLILTDPRFYAWAKIDYKILMEKPVLGWGPENFSVGFDKYYDPAIPYLNQSWGDWWDRAHNIILQTGSDAGILGILAYLFLFIFLFLQLQKLKRHPQESADKNENPRLIAHGIQATFIGYLVANFFGFDSFSTYLIFFLLVGYALYLISSNTTKTENPHEPAVIRINLRIKSAFMFILFCVLIFFLWQYNILPLQINAKINNASNLADQKQCSQAFSAMDKILKEHSFLDSYARLEYVEFTKTCDNFYPENNLTYIQNGIKLINEAVKIQPLYTRYWIYLGSSTGFMASQEKNNPVAENDLMRQANYYFGKASQLSPKRQEVPIAQAKMEIALEDYNGSQNYLEKCIALNPGLADCYWYLGITEIYKKDIADAQKNIQLAHDKIYDIWSKTSLNELSDAYGSISDYQDLVPVYNGLIAINPNVAQYHSSLAFFYAQLGQYDNAKKEALKVLQISPQSSQNVKTFLDSLPH